MSLTHRGLVIGALVGIFVGIMSTSETSTKVISPLIACAFIGWLIGRYMDMRTPRS